MKLTIGTTKREDALIEEARTTEIVRETEKAILISQIIKYTGRDRVGYGERQIRDHLQMTIADDIDLENLTVTRREWLPKSQIQVSKETILIPDWLANKKFFIYD